MAHCAQLVTTAVVAVVPPPFIFFLLSCSNEKSAQNTHKKRVTTRRRRRRQLCGRLRRRRHWRRLLRRCLRGRRHASWWLINTIDRSKSNKTFSTAYFRYCWGWCLAMRQTANFSSTKICIILKIDHAPETASARASDTEK